MIRGGDFPVLACLLAIAASLPACYSTGVSKGATGAESAPLEIRGLLIRNELPYAVTDVMVTVPTTGAFAGCSNIMARTECSTSFRSMTYRGNPMVVDWKEHGEPHHTDEFVVKKPEDLMPGSDARLDVVIFAPGQAGAKLVQYGRQDPER